MSESINMFIEDENNGWNIKVDGYFKKKMTEQLLDDGISDEAIDKIFANSVEILSNCPNPSDIRPSQKTRHCNRKSAKRKNI